MQADRDGEIQNCPLVVGTRMDSLDPQICNQIRHRLALDLDPQIYIEYCRYPSIHVALSAIYGINTILPDLRANALISLCKACPFVKSSFLPSLDATKGW